MLCLQQTLSLGIEKSFCRRPRSKWTSSGSKLSLAPLFKVALASVVAARLVAKAASISTAALPKSSRKRSFLRRPVAVLAVVVTGSAGDPQCV